MTRAPALLKVTHETPEKGLGQIPDWHALALHPIGQKLYRPDVSAGGYLRVTCLAELIGELFRQ
jgi:hypothetical protein